MAKSQRIVMLVMEYEISIGRHPPIETIFDLKCGIKFADLFLVRCKTFVTDVVNKTPAAPKLPFA